MSENLEKFINEVSQEIAELPDRNSPEDWPEAMLVTHDELKEIITGVHENFPLFTHAMPKSEPIAWYYRFKDKKGWRLWNINLGPDKPVNVAFQDMEARPLVFGDIATPQPSTDVSEKKFGAEIFQSAINLALEILEQHGMKGDVTYETIKAL